MPASAIIIAAGDQVLAFLRVLCELLRLELAGVWKTLM